MRRELINLNPDLVAPIPDGIPLPFDEGYRLHLALVLKVIATGGISLRRELCGWIASEIGCQPDSGTLKRLFYSLSDSGLIISSLIPLVGASKVTLVRLSGQGRAACERMGWKPVESEWESLIRCRAADSYPPYAAMTLEFAYQARMRSWGVEIPEGETGADLILQKDMARLPVYVLGRQRPTLQMWSKIKDREPGKIGVLSLRPNQREIQSQGAKAAHLSGYAADLQTLIQRNRAGIPGPLWMQEWLW